MDPTLGLGAEGMFLAGALPSIGALALSTFRETDPIEKVLKFRVFATFSTFCLLLLARYSL